MHSRQQSTIKSKVLNCTHGDQCSRQIVTHVGTVITKPLSAPGTVKYNAEGLKRKLAAQQGLVNTRPADSRRQQRALDHRVLSDFLFFSPGLLLWSHSSNAHLSNAHLSPGRYRRGPRSQEREEVGGGGRERA